MQRRVERTAYALIGAHLVVRALLLSQSTFHQDDFFYMRKSLQQPFFAYLFQDYNGHLMPGQLLVAWFTEHVAPQHWPTVVVVMLVMQAVAGVKMWRALREMTGARWAAIAGLVVYLFAPIAVMPFLWYAAALQSVSLQVAMAGVLLHQVRFMRNGHRLDLALAASWFAFALFFWEKGLAILLVMLMVSMLWFPTTAGWRGAWAAVRRDRWLWCTYGLLAAVYLVLYSTITTPEQGPAQPPSMYVRVGWRALTGGAIPYLLGGPFGDARDSIGGVPPVRAGEVYLAIVLVAMVLTVRRFRPAWRAWALVSAYLFVNVVTNTATRAYIFGAATGLSARYFADLVVVAAIAVPLMWVPVDRPTLEVPLLEPAVAQPQVQRRNAAVGVAAGAVAATYIVCSIATSWIAMLGLPPDQIRTYMANARHDLERLGPVVLHDAVAPGGILMSGRVSDVVIPMRVGARFDEPADQLYATDAVGHVAPVVLVKAATSSPGPDGKCGTKVTNGGTSTLHFAGKLPYWVWTVRIDYFIGSDGAVTVSTGATQQHAVVRHDRHTLFLTMTDRIDDIDVSLFGATAPLCITQVDVGFVPDAPSPRK
jgi:hypothetical protein